MAFRLYIVPAIGSGASTQDARRPKYIHALQPPGAWMDYGFQPIFLCGVDLSPANDTAVIANADVFAFPFDLNTTPTAGQRSTAIAAFEAALIPGNNWVVAGIDWRGIARTIAGMFQFMQRLNGVIGNTVVIDSSAKLNVQFSTLTAEQQNAVLVSAQSLGYNTSFIAPNTQIRAILKGFADAWGNETFHFGPFNL
jgi:hypothetical protein